MIPIQNVYYMLSYAFSTLQENEYKSIETEKFKRFSPCCPEALEPNKGLLNTKRQNSLECYFQPY